LKAERKGLETIRTLRSLVDTFHSRTPYGALIELARLCREREQRGFEVRRWEKRSEQIKTRLKEIEEAEKWLHEVAADDEFRLGGPAEGEKKTAVNVHAGLRETVLKY
jgi:hypothetical protein